jgi:hypothetical protein
MMTWELLHPQVDESWLGLLPSMLNEKDPRPAKEQLDAGYRHGGGWQPFAGFKLTNKNMLMYPGDPPTRPLAQVKLRDELIILFEHAWVAVIQPDRSFEVCRMD